MPLLRCAALLFRRRLFVPRRQGGAPVSSNGFPRKAATAATARTVASLCFFLSDRSGGGWILRIVIGQLVWEAVNAGPGPLTRERLCSGR